MLLRRGSRDDWRVNCRLSVLRIDPVENCLEIPRFNCAATFSMVFDIGSSSSLSDQRSIKSTLHVLGDFVNCVEEDDDERRNDRESFFFLFFYFFLNLFLIDLVHGLKGFFVGTNCH